MAWIESHTELAQHPKTKKLARALGVSVPAAIGHLHLLWWWALSYAQDGDLTRYDNYDIADAIIYDGDADKAVNALIAAGFINSDRTIHDWYDYAGRLIEQRESNRARAKQARDRNAAQEKAGNASNTAAPSVNSVQPEQTTFTHGTDTVRVPCANGTETVREEKPNDTVTCAQGTGLHNSTIPNITEPNNTLPSPPLPPQGGSVAGERPPDIQEQRFNRFWSAYPKKVGKDAARNAWKKRKPSEELLNKILAAVETQKQSDQWRRENGRYIPNPATWLNQGRWDDELPISNGNQQQQQPQRQPSRNPFINAAMGVNNYG